MTTSATALTSERPFVGLAPFTEDDARFFFGRDGDRTVITSNMIASRLTVLYGPSGCGKSSLLDAGVANQVNKIVSPKQIADYGSSEFVVVTFHEWRDRPTEALVRRLHARIAAVAGREVEPPPAGVPLAEALAAIATNVRGALLIVLDQFEEYFLYHGRKVVEGKFAYELAQAINDNKIRANFLISIREDSLAQLDAFEGYIPNLLANTLRLDRLDLRRGRETIIGPIERYNERSGKPDDRVTIKPELVEVVLQAVQSGSINLESAGRGRVNDGEQRDDDTRSIETAYLQLVMTRLWDAEEAAGSRELRLETFQSLGGAQRMVGTHLDTVMNDFAPDERAVAAELLRYLVTPTGTKIALTLSDMADFANLSPDVIEPVLAQLGSQRVRILREVKGPLDDQSSTRHEIFHDVLAGVILDWRRRYTTEQAKIVATRKAAAAQEEEARKAELRRKEELAAADVAWRKAQIRGVLALLCVTTLLSAVAINQWRVAERRSGLLRIQTNRANEQTKNAMIQERQVEEQKRIVEDERKQAKLDAQLSQSTLLAAKSATFINDDPDLSVALALAAVDWAKTAPADDIRQGGVPSTADGALRQALAPSRPRAVMESDDRSRMLSVAYDVDGKRIVTARVDGKAEIWDTATGKLLRGFDNTSAGGRNLRAAEFSGGGRYLTTLEDGGAIAVYDLGSPSTKPERWTGPRTGVELDAFSFSQNRSRVAVATSDKILRVLDLPTAVVSMVRKSDDRVAITSLAFSPDGKTIAVGFKSALVQDQRRAGAVSKGATKGAGQNPGDSRSANHAAVRFCPTSDSRIDQEFHIDITTTPPEIGDVRALAFDPDGKRLAVSTAIEQSGQLATQSGQLKTWREQGGKWVPGLISLPIRVVVDDIAFNAKGTLLASGSTDGFAQLWDPSNGTNRGYMNCQSPVSRVLFSRNGDRLLVGTTDRIAQIWSVPVPVGSVGSLALRGHTGEILDVAFGPDGQTVATASGDGTARIWEASPPPPTSITVPGGPAESKTNPVFTRDSKQLIIAGVDNHIRFVEAATGREVGEPIRHPGPVVSMDLSSDGTKLATAGADKIARTWDISSRKRLKGFAGAFAPLSAVAFSPDGNRLATASHDKRARLFDVSSGECLKSLEGHTRPVTGLAFGHDGTRLATAGLDNTIRVWNTETYEQGLPREGYSSRIDGAVFSPDGRLITANMGVGATIDPKSGAARIMDLETGRVRRLEGHEGAVLAAAFAPDGKTAATAGYDRTIRIWDTSTGWSMATLYGHEARVGNVMLSPKGSYLASDAYDTTGIVWNTRGSVELFRLSGLTSSSTSVLAFSPDETKLATVDRKFRANLWDLRTGRVVHSLEGHSNFINLVEFSPDGRIVATASLDGTARLWDVNSGKLLKVLRGSGYYGVAALSFSLDGSELIAASTDISARIWNVHDASTEAHLINVGAGSSSLVCIPDSKTLAIGCADGTVRFAESTATKVDLPNDTWAATTERLPVFSSDGSRLVTQGQDGLVHLWDTKTQSVVRDLPHPATGFVTAAKFSPNGRSLVTSTNTGILRLWATASPSAPLEIPTKDKRAHELLAFSPDGSMLATGSSSSPTAVLWNTASGAQLKELVGEGLGLIRIAFSQDGKRLVTSSADRTIHVWDIETGKHGLPIKPDYPAYQLSLSPDGARLAMGDGYRARVWDVQTAKPTDLALKATAPVRLVAFSRDGKRIVSAGDFQTVKVWNGQTLALVSEFPGSQSSTTQMDFSPDGKNVLTAGRELSAKIWELETGKLASELPVGALTVTMAYNAGGTLILSTDSANTAKVWDVQTRESVSAMGHVVSSPVKKLAYSADARSVVAAHFDGRVTLWDPQTARMTRIVGSILPFTNGVAFDSRGNRVLTTHGNAIPDIHDQKPTAEIWTENDPRPVVLERFGSPVIEAGFSQDGKRAFTLKKDGSAKVWDMATGKLSVDLNAASFGTAGSALPDAEISLNGKFLAISTARGTIEVWNLEAGKLLTTFSGPPRDFASIGLSPDSTTVAAVYDDGTALLFTSDLMRPLDEVIAKAREVVVKVRRKLTVDELKKYFNDPLVQ